LWRSGGSWLLVVEILSNDTLQAMSCTNFLSRNGCGLTGTVSSLLSFFGDKVGSCFWIGRMGAELARVTLRIKSHVIRAST